jgi:quinol monooxygenase YgiN
MSEIQGVARFKFHEGKVEEFKRLCAQVMDVVRAKDIGTLQYEIYLNDDQSEGIVYERYRNSEAVIEHATNVGDLMEAIFATGSVSSELLGQPSAELTAMTAGGGVSLSTVPIHVETARRLPRAVGLPSRLHVNDRSST